MVIKKSLKGKKVLLTCGPTWVAIDDTRVISNRSTGELGHLIAHLISKQGAKVTMLEGPVVHPFKNKKVNTIRLFFFDELLTRLKSELKKDYDIVIHAAAVSDYRPAHSYGSKLSSEFSQLKLNLVPTEKIINLIKKQNPNVFLVGFKLETQMNKEALTLKAHHLLKKANCDLVVANTHKDGNYCSYIIDKNRKILSQNKSRKDTARNLIHILKARV